MSMKLENLPFDPEGHSKHMDNGTEHNNTTLTIELFDNSDKAVRQRNKIYPWEIFVKLFLNDKAECFHV